MKKFIFPLLFIISLLFNAKTIYRDSKNLTVISVHDGDTFTLGDGQRVRLIGINTSEIGSCGSQEAKDLLTSLVLNKKIKITEEKRDTYGRRMGLVYIGSKLINEEMLKQGWARADYTKNSKSDDLKSAFHYASENKLGVFDKCKSTGKAVPTDPKCNIKGNIDQTTWEKKYFLPRCKKYGQVVLDLDMGEKYFCSEQKAIDEGFVLASECGKI